MGNGRTKEFTRFGEAQAVLSIVVEAWWKMAATPGDLVDVLVAAAGAGLLTEAIGDRPNSYPGAAHRTD